MKRELIVSADGQDRTVVVDGPLAGEDGKFRISIDGVERLVDARPIRPGTWSLVIDGKSYLVDLGVTGAGDTVIAAFTAALAAGATTEEAAQLANYAGGIVVMKRGTATVSHEELLQAIEQTPPATRPH